MRIFTCEICKKEFVRFGKNAKGRFCSVKCKAEFQHKFLSGESSPNWRSDFLREKICNYCGKKFFLKEKCSSTGFQVMKFCSKACADIGGLRYFGAANNKWKGGVKPKIELLRNSRKHKDWSRAVLERDSFTCLICKKCGGDLHAHHIKSFADYPELRFVLDNGITLCVSCHAKLHRPKTGNKFSSIVENGVNSVDIPMGQYRAKPEKEGVEVSSEIMNIKALSDFQSERYDPNLLVTVGSGK